MTSETLSALHLDALNEIFNIGAGRAAASLSAIVGDEVKLSVPAIEIKKNTETRVIMRSLRHSASHQSVPPESYAYPYDSDKDLHNDDKFGAVSQHFTGPFDAEAVLLFSEAHALEIVRDMMGSQMSIDELAEFEQEAMCELGNIILNACLSAVADTLQISLHSSLPSYRIASNEDILQLLCQPHSEHFILVMHIDLIIEKRQSAGHLIFFLGSMSLTNLVFQIERFLESIE